MVILLVCLTMLLATPTDSAIVELSSTVDGGRQFICSGELVTFTCQVLGSTILEWHIPPNTSITYTNTSMPPGTITKGPFEANLTLISNGNVVPVDSNITSTLKMSEPMNEVSVQCLSTQDNETENFTITGIPGIPRNLSVQFGGSTALLNITISWQPPENLRQFDLDEYTINITSPYDRNTSTQVSAGTRFVRLTDKRTQSFRLSTFNVTISATNMCEQTGGATSITVHVPALTGDLRLVRELDSSSSYTSGVLEIYFSGQWGSVCGDFWNSMNSDVACKQLGFSRGARPTSYRKSSDAGLRSGSGPIWLDNVVCVGNESHLISCSNRGIGVHNCDHSDDVAIYCEKIPFGDLRLVRGRYTSTSYEYGRLEIYLYGHWGTVCVDLWNQINSDVACRQLDFAGAARPNSYSTSSNAGFGSDTGVIWLDNVVCVGNESHLINCSNNGVGVHDCDHSEDVAIYCEPRDYRLVVIYSLSAALAVLLAVTCVFICAVKIIKKKKNSQAENVTHQSSQQPGQENINLVEYKGADDDEHRNGLPDPKGSLSSTLCSAATAQANKEVQKAISSSKEKKRGPDVKYSPSLVPRPEEEEEGKGPGFSPSCMCLIIMC